MSDQQRQEFAATLETLYLRSREQSRAGFPEVVERLEEKEA